MPVFDAQDPWRAAAATADSLRIIVLRDSADVFEDILSAATAAIDSEYEPSTFGCSASSVDSHRITMPQQDPGVAEDTAPR